MSRSVRTAEFFDRYARDFEAIYGNQRTWLSRIVNPLFRRSMRLRFERTLQQCEPIAGRTVLDIGCGPGHYSVALAQLGAQSVLGIDFAESMIELARARAEHAGVQDRCRFEKTEFTSFPNHSSFDYAIAMGFMDYVADPRRTIERILSLTRHKALFSFPASGGLLAWQRRLRYRNRCDLYLYSETEIRKLFKDYSLWAVQIERIARDYFVATYAVDEPMFPFAGDR